MRSIGLKNRNLVKKLTIQEIKKQLPFPYSLKSDIDYQEVRKNVVEQLPVELWDTWEMADQEIRGLIDAVIRED